MYTIKHQHWDDYMGTHYPHDEWYVIHTTTSSDGTKGLVRTTVCTCADEASAIKILNALRS